ncbi:octaprenyl diphosphate synthase [Pelistega europaea]|uniref:Octaprenyl diphosphate synthase n=2 Tax=Pelistega europaea TaxID=106147 RepID=A0A7Y4P6Y8_9BURK|nr:octaprenyl diphosphate synthase [Pelistega europaea]
MSVQEIFSPIAADMQAVDSVIRSRLNSEVVMIRTIGEYIISAGGKRMRPALVLMVAKALGYQGDLHHLLAAVIEFIHTSTLLHDDVVDESDMRRGRETANAVFGNAASVLVGDYLYSRSFEMMVEVDSMRVMQILSQATTVIAEGEVLQLLNVHDPDVTVDRYIQVVRYKTAKLFEAAAQVAAVISGASPEVEQAVAAYGRHMGTAFQLIDDVLDYSGSVESLGKNVGDDLREGKPTLPLIRVMQVGTEEQQTLIRQAIETGEADFDAVAQAIQSTDALDYTRQMAERESHIALEALNSLPDSAYKQSMKTLAHFAVSRDR